MKARRSMLLVAVLTGMALLMVGCGARDDAAVRDAPAAPDKVYELIGQGIYGAGNPGLDLQMMFVKMVEELSGGRIKMTLHPLGAVVGAFESFGATSEGVLDFNMVSPMWHVGHEPAMIYFTSIPATFTHHYQMHSWFYRHGGLELAREAYAAHNQYLAGMAIYGNPPQGAEVVHSNVPVRSIDDYRGMTVRSGGAAGKWFQSLGASVVALSGEELFSALERKVVDAVEWVGPTANYPLGLHEAAQYLIMPGLHTLLMASEVSFNMQVWNDLPADLQRIIEVAAMAYGTYKGHAFEDLDKYYLQKMIDEGVEVIVWEEKEVERAMQAGKALWPEFAVNDLSRKVWDSQLKYMKMIGLVE